MTNIIPVAILLLMFFTYVVNGSNWGLGVMKVDKDILNTYTQEYQEQTETLYALGNSVVGKLD